MKIKIILKIFLFSILIFVYACSDNGNDPYNTMTAKPVVKKTLKNYNQESFDLMFPETISLNSITIAYSNNFSEELRIKLLDYMKNEVIRIEEDVNIFNEILLKTGCESEGGYILPTYAERAKFENKEVWLIQLTYGLGEANFAHYKCFAFDLDKLDTLAYIGCR